MLVAMAPFFVSVFVQVRREVIETPAGVFGRCSGGAESPINAGKQVFPEKSIWYISFETTVYVDSGSLGGSVILSWKEQDVMDFDTRETRALL